MNLIPSNSLFDSFFDRDLPSFRLLPESGKEPRVLAVDITETDGGYSLKADFPGLKKNEISVQVDNNVLTLSAEHKEEKETREKGKVLRQERRYGKYVRSFTLGSGVDESRIQAHFADGVLSLEIPKAEPHSSKSKAIPIK